MRGRQDRYHEPRPELKALEHEMGAVYAGDAKAFFPVWRFPDGSNPRSYEAGSTRSLGHLTRCRRTRPRTAGRPWRSARTARGAADRAPGERGLAGRERLIARGERDGGALRHRKPAAAAGPTGAALESAPGRTVAAVNTLLPSATAPARTFTPHRAHDTRHGVYGSHTRIRPYGRCRPRGSPGHTAAGHRTSARDLADGAGTGAEAVG